MKYVGIGPWAELEVLMRIHIHLVEDLVSELPVSFFDSALIKVTIVLW